MKWFKEIFLPSFQKGKELRISEKQFNIFKKYSNESYERGYTEHFKGEEYDAYSWASVIGMQYFVKIER